MNIFTGRWVLCDVLFYSTAKWLKYWLANEYQASEMKVKNAVLDCLIPWWKKLLFSDGRSDGGLLLTAWACCTCTLSPLSQEPFQWSNFLKGPLPQMQDSSAAFPLVCLSAALQYSPDCFAYPYEDQSVSQCLKDLHLQCQRFFTPVTGYLTQVWREMVYMAWWYLTSNNEMAWL